MELVSIVFKKNISKFILITGLSLSAGGIHVLLLILINNTLAGLINGKTITISNFLLALGLLFSYLVINRVLAGITIKFTLNIIHSIRMQLMRSALKASYIEMKEKQELLYSAITKDTEALSHAALTSTHLITSVVVVAGCLIYLAFSSVSIFLFIMAIALLGVLIYLLTSRTSFKYLENARNSEDTLFYHIRQIIDGFREVKLNQAKGTDLVEGPLLEASLKNLSESNKGFTGFYNSSMMGQFLIYIALILLLFIGGIWLAILPSLLMSSIIIVLYIVGPLETLTALIPQLAEGNVAAIRLNKMLLSFEKKDEPQAAQSIPHFNQLKYQSFCFNYPDSLTTEEKGFSVGPLDFELNKNETTFIYGGNGAGKTTFLYLNTGLLKAQQGNLLINNKEIGHDQIPINLFAPVFSDFHLFDRFYGIKNIDMEKAKRYLELFELDKKVSINVDGFSSIKLSTGQRKRLALIAILLESRPIIVLDEWAADQDPVFRAKFYHFIIPALKAEGFTILAITHDDKYYDVADSLYRMEFGKLIKEK